MRTPWPSFTSGATRWNSEWFVVILCDDGLPGAGRRRRTAIHHAQDRRLAGRGIEPDFSALPGEGLGGGLQDPNQGQTLTSVAQRRLSLNDGLEEMLAFNFERFLLLDERSVDVAVMVDR